MTMGMAFRTGVDTARCQRGGPRGRTKFTPREQLGLYLSGFEITEVDTGEC